MDSVRTASVMGGGSFASPAPSRKVRIAPSSTGCKKHKQHVHGSENANGHNKQPLARRKSLATASGDHTHDHRKPLYMQWDQPSKARKFHKNCGCHVTHSYKPEISPGTKKLIEARKARRALQRAPSTPTINEHASTAMPHSANARFSRAQSTPNLCVGQQSVTDTSQVVDSNAKMQGTSTDVVQALDFAEEPAVHSSAATMPVATGANTSATASTITTTAGRAEDEADASMVSTVEETAAVVVPGPLFLAEAPSVALEEDGHVAHTATFPEVPSAPTSRRTSLRVMLTDAKSAVLSWFDQGTDQLAVLEEQEEEQDHQEHQELEEAQEQATDSTVECDAAAQQVSDAPSAPVPQQPARAAIEAQSFAVLESKPSFVRARSHSGSNSGSLSTASPSTVRLMRTESMKDKHISGLKPVVMETLMQHDIPDDTQEVSPHSQIVGAGGAHRKSASVMTTASVAITAAAGGQSELDVSTSSMTPVLVEQEQGPLSAGHAHKPSMGRQASLMNMVAVEEEYEDDDDGGMNSMVIETIQEESGAESPVPAEEEQEQATNNKQTTAAPSMMHIKTSSSHFSSLPFNAHNISGISVARSERSMSQTRLVDVDSLNDSAGMDVSVMSKAAELCTFEEEDEAQLHMSVEVVDGAQESSSNFKAALATMLREEDESFTSEVEFLEQPNNVGTEVSAFKPKGRAADVSMCSSVGVGDADWRAPAEFTTAVKSHLSSTATATATAPAGSVQGEGEWKVALVVFCALLFLMVFAVLSSSPQCHHDVYGNGGASSCFHFLPHT